MNSPVSVIESLLRSSDAVRWLFYGDSITHGAQHTLGKRDFSELFREHVIWELKRQNDLVLNAAYSGYTLRELIREFDFRAGSFRPHAAFVIIGTNDCVKYPRNEFEKNLYCLLEKFNSIQCKLILQTPLPLISELDPVRAENLQYYPDMISHFAEKNHVALIDHWRMWNRISKQERYYLMSDPVHPNEMGHLLIAQKIFRDLHCFSGKYPVCRMQPGAVSEHIFEQDEERSKV